MSVRKKLTTVLAASVISISMGAPTFAMDRVSNAVEYKRIQVWKSFGEGHDEKFTGMGKHAEDSFSKIGVESNGDLKEVYTNHLSVKKNQRKSRGLVSGYIESLQIYGKSSDNIIHNGNVLSDNGIERVFEFSNIEPREKASTNEKYFKAKAKIKLKVFITMHKDKEVFLQPLGEFK